MYGEIRERPIVGVPPKIVYKHKLKDEFHAVFWGKMYKEEFSRNNKLIKVDERTT